MSTPPSRRQDIRNVAIIAHVDHGKTTLVDCMLRQSGRYRQTQLVGEQILDCNDLERERGITILAKNIAVPYQGVKINIIDTPGHADFGGEVERVLRMADGALVLVDAAEGPMPQTRFVLQQGPPIPAAADRGHQQGGSARRPAPRGAGRGVRPVPAAGRRRRAGRLPAHLASSKLGFATHDLASPGDSVRPLMDMILSKIPGPEIDARAPLQMLVTTLDWSDYVGKIAIGRIYAGEVRTGMEVALAQKEGQITPGRLAAVYVFEDLGRIEVPSAEAGDIVALVGLETVEIGDTVDARDCPRPLPRLTVDEPTLKMTFGINTSPLAGREGRFLTSRHLRERLAKELQKNVALRVEPIVGTEQFSVSGRGILHLSVLIETMRREGYELSIGKPHVILHEVEGATREPFETLVVEVPQAQTGPVMEMIGQRRGKLLDMTPHNDYSFLTFSIPARGLIGLRTRLLNATQGTAVIHHRFDGYRPMEGEILSRATGVLVSIAAGRAVAYGLDTLQQRSELHVAPGDVCYEGMIVGENSRAGDMNVNPTKEKKLSNMRAVGHDRNILLRPARRLSLEEALEFIEEDELVEVTPTQIRLRKIILKELDRKRTARRSASAVPG